MVMMRVNENALGSARSYIGQIIDVNFFGKGISGYKSHDIFINNDNVR